MDDIFEIINKDCLKAMKDMEDNTVDAIVTDPPYGLSFMGAEWDSFGTDTRQPSDEHYWVPDNPYGRAGVRYGWNQDKSKLAKSHRAFQERMTPIFEEALRVSKAGAHILCFGGTRTFHRLACSLEDAGWEIRDTIMWVYGCLDEETEILVDGEFVPYNKAKIGSLALGYDIERGTFSWQRIEDTYLYDYEDTAYAIQSDSTDQLVSRNHRCIVERGGVEQFAFAELVAQEREASVPVLEGLQGLLNHLSMPDQGTGDKEQDLLEGMRGEGGESDTKEAQGAQAEHDMPSVREGVLHTDGVEAQGKDELLLNELQVEGGMRSEATEVQQRASHSDVGGAEGKSQEGYDGGWKSVVEGRRVKGERERAEAAGRSGEMPEGIPSDGTEGWLDSGASACGGATGRKASGQERGRASHRPRPVEQRPVEPDAVQLQRRPQEVRKDGFSRTTLARVEAVHYKGKMWCVKVKTGAFVARRHGKVFVTGNSGFPHGMDVSKAIDRELGAKRNVIGEHPNPAGNKGGGNSLNLSVDGMPEKAYITEPASDQAKQWDGWNTQLKPAWEPIIVARKTLDGTVAHNVMTYGTGAINIDACRVPTSDKLGGGMRGGGSEAWDRPWMHDEQAQAEFVERKKSSVAKSENMGRFPANLVHDGSQEVLELFPNDSGRFFYCAKASKKDRGEGNNHPTIKPNALMRYLVRLVCRKGGLVLDPFMGSGSTGVACMDEGMSFVGIELDEHYCDIARSRIGNASQK